MNLEQNYNRDDFLLFLKSFIPNFSKDIRRAATDGLQVTKEVFYLGESSELNLSVFELTHSSSTDARVALAMDGFKIMKNSATYRALVVYRFDKEDDWRLSLMTATPSVNQEGKVSQVFSNPRRFSFFLGQNAKVNTPYQFLIKQGSVKDFSELQKRFSIEVVNKEFYAQISELFTELVGGTRGEGRNQRKYPGIIALPSVSKESKENHEFAVRLIGRLIFCWFLREKKSITDLPLISKDILSLEAANNNPDYYHSVLEPLFFEVLNKPTKSRVEEYRNSFFGKTPYLNGGLFTPQTWDYYDSKLRSVLRISDEWIRKLFEVLEVYNFTVDENTSVDIDLSIDPEMLGRIFENLLAEINPETGESARKSTGSYYTPRTIVDYMVDESLIQYLKDKTGIDEGKIRVLVSYDLNDDEDYPLNEGEKDQVVESLSKITILDPACGSGAFPIGALQKIVFILQRIDQDAKLWFKQQIESSAPEIKRIIEREFAERNFDYIRKLGIIRQSIFGVDIQPIATEIARLRCFLTLVVDERVVDGEENRGIEPLPNLDFKFVTANSLVGLPNSQANSQVGLFEDQEGINKLKEVRDMYFSASGTEREQLKVQFVQIQNKMFQKMIQEHTLADLTQKLSTWDPFGHEASDWFDPDWMFGVNDGFDIVIANPPYIGERKNEGLFHEVIKSEFGRRYYTRWMDYFYFFFHLAFEYSSDNTIIAFISTNYYLTATGGRKLRKDFKLRSNVLRLINFNELKIFENALGQHNMITIITTNNDRECIAKNCITKRKGVAKVDDLQKIIDWNDKDTDYYKIAQNELYEGSDYQIRISGTSNNSDLPNITNILSKTKSNSIPLGIIMHITMGIVTLSDTLSQRHLDRFPEIHGEKGDGIYVLSNEELQELNLSESEKKKFIRPFYKNSDIKHYYSEMKNKSWLIYIKDEGSHIELELPLKEHFEKYKKLIVALKENFLKNKIAASIVKKWFANNNYFVLFTPKKEEYFTRPKIIVPYRSKENYFAYNEASWFGSKDIGYIQPLDSHYSLKYILAILNSKLIFRWLYFRGKRKGETLELYQKPLSEIPIKKIFSDEQKPFIEIVDKILALTSSSDYLSNTEKQARVKNYQKQIDKLVYELYGLTPEEIEVVERGQ
ncbi:MAG: TaqI-like C-terminal specificity domain-containing protein [Candidatus Daviesbacteria bacterium]|nr:TaqI-like C-terminal specificity domain-containing protein [Candidatus Daviesbacteria bacterium]